MEICSRKLAADALLQLSSQTRVLPSAQCQDASAPSNLLPLDLSQMSPEDINSCQTQLVTYNSTNVKSIKQSSVSVYKLIETSEQFGPNGMIKIVYKCKCCLQVFSHKRSCGRHINCKHTLVNHYSCNLCPKMFGRMDHLKIHARVHLKGKLMCSHCNFGYKTKAALQSHICRNHRTPEQRLARSKDKCKKQNKNQVKSATQVIAKHQSEVVPYINQQLSPPYHYYDKMLENERGFYFQAVLDLCQKNSSTQVTPPASPLSSSDLQSDCNQPPSHYSSSNVTAPGSSSHGLSIMPMESAMEYMWKYPSTSLKYPYNYDYNS